MYCTRWLLQMQALLVKNIAILRHRFWQTLLIVLLPSVFTLLLYAMLETSTSNLPVSSDLPLTRCTSHNNLNQLDGSEHGIPPRRRVVQAPEWHHGNGPFTVRVDEADHDVLIYPGECEDIVRQRI